jgi:hypothetical protein
VSGSGEPGFLSSPSKDEMAPRLVSSRPWLDERRSKERMRRERRSPSCTGPLCERRETFARWSSGGQSLRKGSTRRKAVGGTCPGMRAGGHDEDSRARECDHVSMSKWHHHRRPSSRGKHARKSLPHLARGSRRVGGDTPDRGDPHVLRCAESKRSRPHPKHLSRKIATRGRGRGDGGVRGGARAMRCAGRQRPTPPELDPPKRARCRETPSAPVSRGLRPVVASAKALRSSVSRGKTRSPHDTMGARFRIRG